MIRAGDNIPILSYILLGGKCRNCGTKISIRYPLIELVTALLFGLAAAKFDLSPEAFVYAAFFWVLVVLSVIDLEERLLPDLIVIPSIAVGWIAVSALAIYDGNVGEFSGVSLLLSLAVVGTVIVVALIPAALGLRRRKEEDVEVDDRPLPAFDPKWLVAVAAWIVLMILALVEGDRAGLSGALLGTAIFSGLFVSIVLVSPAGMGGGDVKLAVLLGTFVGYLGAPGLVLAAMFLSFLSGAVIGVVATALRGGGRKTAIPFGPFLCLGTITAIAVGQKLIDVYSELLS